MCEVLANVIRSIDVFGPPAASQFTFKTKTHHSTVCGGIFGIALISLSAWFFALECRNLSSQDIYASSQVMFGMPMDQTYSIPTTDSIMAFRNSKANDQMIGVYWHINKATNEYTPLTQVLCSELYSGNSNILRLLNDTETNPNKWQCLDAASIASYTPLMSGNDEGMVLEVTTCKNATTLYFQRTRKVFPYLEYGLDTYKCSSEDPIGALTPVTTQIRMIGKTLNMAKVLQYQDNSAAEFYEIDLDNIQSMVNLTQATTTVKMVRQDFNIGHSRIWNEGSIADAFARQSTETYRTKGTNFDFDYTRPQSWNSTGHSMVYLTYVPQLSQFKGVTQADLYLTFPVAAARLGGFILMLWFFSGLMLSFWNFFNQNNEVTDAMITFSRSEEAEGSPKERVLHVVEHQGDLDYNFFQHIFCLNSAKRQMHTEAIDKIEEEMNMVCWAGAARRAEFLGGMQENAHQLDLIKYGRKYRFESPAAVDYEREEPFAEGDLTLSREMNERNAPLFMHVTGDDTGRPASQLF